MITRRGLTLRGITYDTGTNFEPGSLSRAVWRDDLMRQELRVIAEELRCNAVGVYGTDVGRLTECAAAALDRGLHVLFEPMLVEGSARATLDHLLAAADAAEQLRARYGNVTLVLGCELTLFMSGILPGRTFVQRARGLALLWWLSPWLDRRLNRFLRKANAAVRSRFGGPTTYAAGTWEHVDWSVFDLVGLNYYLADHNRARYVADLRAFHRFGKPVVITEFGCCPYEGAAEEGPTVDEKIDWSGPVPEFTVTRVRNEQVQSDYIAHLLELYESEDVYGAFVFDYVAPTYPHVPGDPRRDLDMASFSVVKVYPDGAERPYGTGYWEPKAAFHEIARRYAAAGAGRHGEGTGPR